MYSIMPHSGDWRGANTPGIAYRFNVPVTAVPGKGGGRALAPFSQVDRENVMTESVKRALGEEATVIRLYESVGQRTKARLSLGFAAAHVWKASMMEDRQEEIAARGGVIELELRPYEIMTLIAQ